MNERYHISYCKCWHNIEEEKPPEGLPVLVLEKWGCEDPDAWTTEVAYYCDGGFWNLSYDSNLGVMRKNFYGVHPEYWAQYIIPDPKELKE